MQECINNDKNKKPNKETVASKALMMEISRKRLTGQTAESLSKEYGYSKGTIMIYVRQCKEELFDEGYTQEFLRKEVNSVSYNDRERLNIAKEWIKTKNTKEIIEKYKITYETIRIYVRENESKLKRLNLISKTTDKDSYHAYNKEKRMDIVKSYFTGKTIKQLAEEYELSPTTVVRYIDLHRAEVVKEGEVKDKPISIKRINEIKVWDRRAIARKVFDGYSIPTIREEFGVTLGVVETCLSEFEKFFQEEGKQEKSYKRVANTNIDLNTKLLIVKKKLDGVINKEITREFGIGQTTIYRYLRQYKGLFDKNNVLITEHLTESK